jgi:AraC-like DNA-binding protein
MYGEALSTALAVQLLREYGAAVLGPKRQSGGLPHEKLVRAVEYIRDQLHTDRTVSGIAQAVYMSPYHFTRLFKESTGQSPYRYVVDARVRKAKELLTTGKSAILSSLLSRSKTLSTCSRSLATGSPNPTLSPNREREGAVWLGRDELPLSPRLYGASRRPGDALWTHWPIIASGDEITSVTSTGNDGQARARKADSSDGATGGTRRRNSWVGAVKSSNRKIAVGTTNTTAGAKKARTLKSSHCYH